MQPIKCRNSWTKCPPPVTPCYLLYAFLGGDDSLSTHLQIAVCVEYTPSTGSTAWRRLAPKKFVLCCCCWRAYYCCSVSREHLWLPKPTELRLPRVVCVCVSARRCTRARGISCDQPRRRVYRPRRKFSKRCVCVWVSVVAACVSPGRTRRRLLHVLSSTLDICFAAMFRALRSVFCLPVSSALRAPAPVLSCPWCCFYRTRGGQ